ncbi:hypothetical protein AMIS_17680 [Actinoplanes missouriensis 431]|uniref:Uncharacterized protein n=1 Tax=Actinoplanes missouriensis (strain ATCC 14538 / DSM 43046 / CBS 188.64 / JCM 3121 / NBRC 102363 / NCIMB 12654 / NRRL B-3342 / UNCC 431) TaxID=512565 RepID=I0H1V1_ACTM4|nr:hypothetical protein [Actinoplanes missouriensis]BAL86988.1 hypothetical protein AMIS_17680 [Actinoplanes missouriensis 431]
MDRPGAMKVGDVVAEIVRRLGEQQRVVPEYIVRDAVEAALSRRFPGATPAPSVVLPGEIAGELIEGFCAGATTSEDDAATMPAVLSGDETGRLITALGLAVHVAAFNLDRDRLHVAQILNGAAAALVALGAAERAAHADGTSAVLLSPATLRTVRTTVAGVLQGTESRGWQARHLDQDATSALFTGVLAMLGAVP